MVSTKLLTKQEIIDLVNQQYSDVSPNDVIACIFAIADDYKTPKQQCLLFDKELEV